jgi:hypothetical protein
MLVVGFIELTLLSTPDNCEDLGQTSLSLFAILVRRLGFEAWQKRSENPHFETYG